MAKSIAAGLVLMTVLTSGCTIGPRAIRVSHSEYNRAVQQTSNEQLLLNLVRLRYRDTPLSLELGSISTQFVFAKSASVSGQLNENVGPGAPVPDVLGIGADVAYQDRPTITYSPLRGEALVQSLMYPLDLDRLMLLYYSGWRVDRMLLTTVQRLNRVGNAMRAAGPTPPVEPVYSDFARVAECLRDLQSRGLLDLGYDLRLEDVSEPVPTECVTATDMAKAAEQGYFFRRAENGRDIQIAKQRRVPVLQIAVEALQSQEVRDIVEILRLVPGQTRYDLVPGYMPPPTNKDERYDSIMVGTRSVLGSLFYLSQAVNVPSTHEQKGIVTVTKAKDGQKFDWSEVTGKILQIHCSKKRPTDAAVSVRHRGYWFYVSDSDLTSKSTFSLLRQLLSLQAGGAKLAAPLLTLPVGG